MQTMIKLGEILKKVGGSVLREVVPGGGILISAVNALLPPEKQLPASATGSQIESCIDGLEPEQRVELLSKEFDVSITEIKESNETLRTMLTVDATSPHTTRPKVVMGAFYVVAYITILIVSMWAYAVLIENEKLVEAVSNSWPFVLTFLGPFITWLNSYFGVLRKEAREKLNAANGVPSTGLIGVIGSLIKK